MTLEKKERTIKALRRLAKIFRMPPDRRPDMEDGEISFLLEAAAALIESC